MHRTGGPDLAFTRQVGVPAYYKAHIIGEHRPDLVVAQQLVVEIKSVDRLNPVHEAQVLTYMRILKVRVGLLLNFNSAVLKTSIRRLAL